jgi:hypothetical protein
LKNQTLGTFFYMLYLVAMMQPVMPLIEYNLNKEYIVSTLCENRDKPELACNGKCYLQTKIEQSEQKSHDHSIPKIDLSKYPVSLVDVINSSKKEKGKKYNKPEFYDLVKKTNSFHTSLFKPPISVLIS